MIVFELNTCKNSCNDRPLCSPPLCSYDPAVDPQRPASPRRGPPGHHADPVPASVPPAGLSTPANPRHYSGEKNKAFTFLAG